MKTQSDLITAGDSLQNSIDRLYFAQAKLRLLLPSLVGGPMSAMVGLGALGLGNVMNLISTGAGIIGVGSAQIIGIATDLAMAGRNAFWTLNAVGGYDDETAFTIDYIAASFENALCILVNAFREWPSYPDYSGMFGASVCSSTVGGSPLSAFTFTNPFETYVDSPLNSFVVTGDARSNLDLLNASDPIQAPLSAAALLTAVAAISGGVTFP